MTNITITISLSDLVDVVNNSKSPEVCKHLLAGGHLMDLDKKYKHTHDFFTHRIIWDKKDGQKTDNFVMLQAIAYNPWEDSVTARVLEKNGDMYYRTEYSWSAWCVLEEVQGDEYALMDLESDPATELN